MAEGDTGMEARASARIGSVLRGKYRLDRVLGLGGMAAVYAATHRNQKQLAIKMLHADLAMRPEVGQRFLREGYAANSVKHRGAVAVLDDDTSEDGVPYLVMELLEGASLEAIWEAWGFRVPLQYALAASHQLLDVLVAAHARGIVHRDIKPANVFVTYEGQLKVLDFGIARVRDAAGASALATTTGSLLGTPAFMSPEQAYGKALEIDAQTDVWAVGATLFALLSGKQVHEGESTSEIVIKTATTPPRSLAVVAPDLPSRAVSVVDRALGFAKADRWPSAAAMRDAVASAHQALFGRPPEAGALLPLLSRVAPPPQTSVPPAALESGPLPEPLQDTSPVRPLVVVPGRAFPAPPAEVLLDGSTIRLDDPRLPAEARSGASGPALIGVTTARPVFGAPSKPTSVIRRAPILVVVASFSGSLLIAGLIVAALHRRTGATPPRAIAAPPSAAIVPTPAADPPPVVLPMETAAAPSASTAPVSVEDPPPAPPASAAASAASPVPTRPAWATAPIPSGLTGVPPTTTSCAPPYFFDARGRKIFKPECVK